MSVWTLLPQKLSHDHVNVARNKILYQQAISVIEIANSSLDKPFSFIYLKILGRNIWLLKTFFIENWIVYPTGHTRKLSLQLVIQKEKLQVDCLS